MAHALNHICYCAVVLISRIMRLARPSIRPSICLSRKAS